MNRRDYLCATRSALAESVLFRSFSCHDFLERVLGAGANDGGMPSTPAGCSQPTSCDAFCVPDAVLRSVRDQTCSDAPFWLTPALGPYSGSDVVSYDNRSPPRTMPKLSVGVLPKLDLRGPIHYSHIANLCAIADYKNK